MAEILQGFSDALADTVASAGQSVVRVDARRRLPASGIVWTADGVIVTSHHVVERDDNITVGLPSGESVAATLVGCDPSTDLAVLRAQVNSLTVLPRAGGGTRSAFGADGLMPGTERGERYFLWPMGVESAGQMRQWGHHATAFVGRRHFDDPRLLASYFTPRPAASASRAQ